MKAIRIHEHGGVGRLKMESQTTLQAPGPDAVYYAIQLRGASMGSYEGNK
ncbi:MAG TPA: hypothetical protein VJP02_20005 [Candidatus Sulfotelmatobacter sp.]|nr:hypothetical protein [Candidatus Sulfotelmatobacter sp.]